MEKGRTVSTFQDARGRIHVHGISIGQVIVCATPKIDEVRLAIQSRLSCKYRDKSRPHEGGSTKAADSITPVRHIIIITNPRTSLRKHARSTRKVSTKRDIKNQTLRTEERAHAAVGRGVVDCRRAEDARVDGGRIGRDVEGGRDVGPGEEPDVDGGVGEFGDELAAACAGEGGAVRVCGGVFDDATFVGVGLVGAVGRVHQCRSLVGAGDGTALRSSGKRVR